MNGMTFDAARVRAALPGHRIEYFPTIDSTMTAAARLEKNAIVIADEQTKGQGRHGHGWHSEKSAGLYFTMVLQPRIALEELPVVTLALGLATQEAIAQVAGVNPDLRWPNDLLIGTRKCGGILTQLHEERVLAGIGINVNHTKFPGDIASIATSLRIATGQAAQREELLCAIATGVDRMIALLEEQGPPPILSLFTAQSSYVRGRKVRVDLPGGELMGTTAGLTRDGYLLVDGDDGRRHTILAGGVRPAE